jgi:flagellar biosynthesis/type III secretory pathway ATPase
VNDEAEKKQRKSKAVPQITTDHSALMRINARALANQIACYIILIL